MEKKNTDREYLTRLEKLKEQSPQEQKELLEKGEIDKIIIFCNTVATKDSAKLGLIIG